MMPRIVLIVLQGLVVDLEGGEGGCRELSHDFQQRHRAESCSGKRVRMCESKMCVEKQIGRMRQRNL